MVDQAKGVNNNLSLNGLDRIDDNSNGSRRQPLKALLSADVDGREPAAEAWMRMVPANDGLGPVNSKR
jgi:hypothetical protein